MWYLQPLFARKSISTLKLYRHTSRMKKIKQKLSSGLTVTYTPAQTVKHSCLSASAKAMVVLTSRFNLKSITTMGGGAHKTVKTWSITLCFSELPIVVDKSKSNRSGLMWGTLMPVCLLSQCLKTLSKFTSSSKKKSPPLLRSKHSRRTRHLPSRLEQ